MKKQVLIITTGYSSFVAELSLCNQLSIVGILDCQSSVELRKFANERNIPYKEFYKQDEQIIQWIKKQNPEVIAVFKMPFLLKKEIFSFPKYGTVNYHPSLLPAYRGPNPWFWVYYNMEKESGITIHFVDEGEDSGNIIYQDSFYISIGDQLEYLKNKSIEIGTKLMIKTLCNIENVRSTPQPKSSPTMRAQNVFNFTNLVDWDKWGVEKIWHLLSGFPEVLQENESYLCLNKKLIPQYYSIETINSRTGEFTLGCEYYILRCIDGVIWFLEES
jgi:methionyl-tRNA formyltransferase